jgi:hypothetical protein
MPNQDDEEIRLKEGIEGRTNAPLPKSDNVGNAVAEVRLVPPQGGSGTAPPQGKTPPLKK